MNCWHCSTELIWGGDDDLDDESCGFSMVTNLSCPDCESYVEVYYPTLLDLPPEKELAGEE